MTQADHFQALIDDALAQDFSGWDFSYLKGRWQDSPLPWDYEAQVREQMPKVESLLDMGTGGGEFLSSLAPLPKNTHATEAWEPNVPVATKRLEPFGVKVHAITDDKELPFADETFDLIINRHESFWTSEIYRILKPGGLFITQQVGGANCDELNERIVGTAPKSSWGRTKAHYWLHRAGFAIEESAEAFPNLYFFDIGAVVFYLKVIEWQIKDFSVEKYRDALLKLHQQMEAGDPLTVLEHRFLIVARK